MIYGIRIYSTIIIAFIIILLLLVADLLYILSLNKG